MDASPTMTARGEERLVLVTGATGQQGGAALRHLRVQGFPVRALTRDLHADRARALAAAGVEVVQGDFDDRASLDRALDGAYGVYAVQQPGPDEARQGIALADAAKGAGIRHVVYGSVGGAERHTGIAHFESKFAVEEHIRALDLPHTILRPASFMENFNRSRDAIVGGTLTFPLAPTTLFQMVAVDDIGAFGALAFAQPDQWLGRIIEVAGDALTMPQAVEVFGRVIGRPVRYAQMPMEMVQQAMGQEAATMFTWFNDAGFTADIPALRALYPPLATLEQWLRRTGWAGAAERL